jgi:hypothetical protein
MSRLTVGGLLAVSLLGLYLYALIVALGLARSCPGSCPQLPDSISLLLQTLGALVAAVVVSELAVTKPKDSPGTRIAAELPAGQQSTAKVLVSLYILAWLASGLALIVMGWIQNPTVPQVVSAAKEWLGFAIAATYAYFGVSS